MSKTEKKLREAIAKKGFVTFEGKRAFEVIERLEAAGKLAGLAVHRDVFNARSAVWKSQWNCPKSRTSYLTTVVSA